MEHSEYEARLIEQEGEYELRCNRCGKCCGVNNDPCINLLKLANERYHCRDYANRFRMHKTIGGNTFHCIPIKELVKKGTAPESCAYIKAPHYEPVS